MQPFEFNTPTFSIGEPIDRDAPGNWARVLSAVVQLPGEEDPTPVALKIMQSRHLEKWQQVFNMFYHESRLLLLLEGNPFLTPLKGFGYLKPSAEIPRCENNSPHEQAFRKTCFSAGQGILFSLDEHKDFEIAPNETDIREQDMLPFLLLELVEKPERYHSLRRLVKRDAFLNQNLNFQDRKARPLPIPEALQLFKSQAEWLVSIHEQKIGYKDYKLEHAYWDGWNLRAIDLNLAVYLDRRDIPGESLTLEQISANVLEDIRACIWKFFYPILTGKLIMDSDFVPNQPDIKPGVRRRLGSEIVKLIEDGCAGNIETADQLLERVRICREIWSDGAALRALHKAVAKARDAHFALLEAQRELSKADMTAGIYTQEVRRIKSKIERMLDESVFP